MPAVQPAPPARAAYAPGASLLDRYRAVRAFTERLTEPLATEDFVVQSMTDVSPTKWHLAHTTWFWETFVLREFSKGYRLHDERYPFLFNSYYVQAGERHCRAQRGYLSRPTVAEVFAFRRYVDEHVERLLDGAGEGGRLAEVVHVGLNHEQQHQELLVTDIKHVFSVNPLRPAYREGEHRPAADPGPLRWADFDAQLVEIGHAGGGFHFDNEGPRHRAFLEPFALADRLTTCGEYLQFMADGGYRRPELWLSEGWAVRTEHAWTEPFYWERADGPESDAAGWKHFTLAGMRPVDPHEPVTHLSYYEADAFARWAGRRLPTEFEWEAASRTVWDGRGWPDGTFAEDEAWHPAPAGAPAGGDGAAEPRLRQMLGDAWEWTRSAYAPYPGYRPAPGALGEYNGKFMVNQYVLRGGSCATSRTHVRPTYRNFFPAYATWQFSGVRLADDRR